MGFYRKVARDLSADQVRALISETRQAVLEGWVKTSAGRYFVDLAKRKLEKQRPVFR